MRLGVLPPWASDLAREGRGLPVPAVNAIQASEETDPRVWESRFIGHGELRSAARNGRIVVTRVVRRGKLEKALTSNHAEGVERVIEDLIAKGHWDSERSSQGRGIDRGAGRRRTKIETPARVGHAARTA